MEKSLFLNTLSKKLLSEKNKEIILMGDFNIDLLKYEKDHNAVDFPGQINSTSLVPNITSTTRITSYSETLIDNMFSTDISGNAISGNNVASITNFYFCQLMNLKGIITRTHITLNILINKYSLRIFKI